MIAVTQDIAIDEKHLSFDFVRASGPGGQNVNKVATAVQLRFDLDGCRALSAPVRRRLKGLAGARLTRDGYLVIEAKRFRTQERNRQDAVDRLVALIRRAAQPVKRRKKTAPTPASKERKLAAKRRRSRIKALRGKVSATVV